MAICWWKSHLKTLQIRIFFLISFMTYLIILPLLLKEDFSSPYYKLFEHNQTKDGRVAAYIQENDARISHSKTVIKQFAGSQSGLMFTWKPTTQFKVLVTVITVSRRQNLDKYFPDYLTQSFAKLIELKERAVNLKTDIKVLICNVDQREHSELLNFGSITPVIHVGHSTKNSKVNRYEKEKLDYIACINHSLSISPDADYYLIMEDDALPNLDMLDKMDHLLIHRIPRVHNMGFVKLFHPTRLNGYITADLNRLLEWFAIASILEHFLLLFQYICGRADHASLPNRVLWYIYFILFVLAVGRHNIVSFRNSTPFLHRLVPAPSCCTPAILYSPNSAKIMANYLASHSCKKGFAKDTVMDRFSQNTSLSSWFFEPNIFTHIGVYTTQRDSLIDPILVN